MTEDEKNKAVLSMHAHVVNLHGELTDIINKFLANEEIGVAPVDRLLVASRAINYQSKQWHSFFYDKFDAEKFIEAIKEKIKTQ